MPALPQDLLDRIRALESEVRRLSTAAQRRPPQDRVTGGDVVIGEGGRLIAREPGGNNVFISGQTPQGDWGVGIGRQDGRAALTVGDEVTASGQMVRMWSRSGNVIVMDDPHGARWLGRPCLPLPWQPTESAFGFTGGTLTTAWLAYVRAQNPVLYLRLETVVGASTTTAAELQISNVSQGAPYSTLATYTAGAGVTFHDSTLPLDGVQHFDQLQLRLVHRRTSGSGTVGLRVLGAVTRQAFTVDEAPD